MKTQLYKLKFVCIAFSLLLTSVDLKANENYESNFNTSYFTQYIGRDLKHDLNGKSLEDKQKEIYERLSSNENIHSCFGVGQTLTSNKEFFIQDAFIDTANYRITTNSKNWMAAWFSLLEETVLNKPEGQSYPDFVNDTQLIEKLSRRLENVSATDEVTDYGVPSQEDPTVKLSTQMYGIDEQCELTLRTYFRKLQRIASPLYVWLLQQPNKSVSPIDLFKKAKSIYKDSWTALGVIGFITGHDSGNLANDNRNKLAVATFKLQPIFTNATDHAGTVYHFWGFVVRSVLKNGAKMDNFKSFLFEGVYQWDAQDREADLLGIESGKQILDYIRTSKHDTIHF